jgi:hypothetical protein
MDEKRNPTRGFKFNICLLLRYLCGEIPGREFISIAEKVVYSLLLIGRFFSFSNFFTRIFDTEKKWSNFLDVYLIIWPTFLFFILFKWPFTALISAIIAVYQISMILSNQLAVLLIDSQRIGWKQPSIGRGFILSLVNFSSIVISFAIIYRALNCVVINGSECPEQSPLHLLYYSLVTVTTLGYGDFVPFGDIGYMVAIAELVTVVLFVLAVIPAYLGALSQKISNEY